MRGVGVQGGSGRRGSRLEAFCLLKLDLHGGATTNGTASWFPNLENRAEFGPIPEVRGPTQRTITSSPRASRSAGAARWALPGTLSAAPGSSALSLLVPSPEPSSSLPGFCTGYRRAECLGCGISQQVVSPGSWQGLNIKGWAAQPALSGSPDAVAQGAGEGKSRSGSHLK